MSTTVKDGTVTMSIADYHDLLEKRDRALEKREEAILKSNVEILAERAELKKREKDIEQRIAEFKIMQDKGMMLTVTKHRDSLFLRRSESWSDGAKEMRELRSKVDRFENMSVREFRRYKKL